MEQLIDLWWASFEALKARPGGRDHNGVYLAVIEEKAALAVADFWWTELPAPEVERNRALRPLIVDKGERTWRSPDTTARLASRMSLSTRTIRRLGVLLLRHSEKF